MRLLFLDIETVPNYSFKEYIKEKDKKTQKFKYGALNPFDGKVVAIAYKIEGEKKNILMEWESSEKDILKKFYKIIDKDDIVFVGFNIATFDIPFLYERFRIHGFREEAYKKLFSYIIDLLQIHYPLNNYQRKGLSFVALCNAYKIKLKKESGESIRDYYYNKEYDRIIEYINNEFVHEELYSLVRRKLRYSLGR
ncbi:MAG: 3'-5' exonuclease [Candidatus Thermoplasmatota archaeon]